MNGILSLCLVWLAILPFGYYLQAIHGEVQLLTHRQSIDKLIAEAKTPEKLRQQLQLVQQLRQFAMNELKLPVDGDYDKYVEVHRKYVVWDVQAAPEFSLQPKAWRYPFVGSLEYRGYFSEKSANDYGKGLAKKGFDVYVDGVDAYSTLGWFKDPLLSTFIDNTEAELAELLFHELAHKRIFAAGDTDFNEAYATTVGQEGARLWLRSRGETSLLEQYNAAIQRDDEFVHLVMDARALLEKVYGDMVGKDGSVTAARTPPGPPAELRREKQRVFDDLRHQYEELKTKWGGYSGYDDWFARDLNNAKLNTVANYYDYLPPFQRLLQQNGGDIPKFNAAVEVLSKKPFAQRHQELRSLMAAARHCGIAAAG
ncbi:MAG TPA: aminopeptidase [Terriglobia bacterium]